MTTRTDDDRLTESGSAMEAGYAAWKRAKVEAGLAQSRDRAAMIPVERIWRDLKLER